MAVFTYGFGGGTHVVVAGSGVQMMMLVRKKKEYFTDFIANEARLRRFKAVINGSFVSLSNLSKVAVRLTSGPLEASESIPAGQVIQDGKQLAGTDGTGKFHFAQEICGTQKFTAGLGNPAASASSAIGGIAPIIVDGLSYGAFNLYKPGVPAGAPATGDVADPFKPYLTQKSNLMFSNILQRGGKSGKVAIGYSNAKEQLVILVQKDGATGLDANGIRQIFKNTGVNNAVFLDCSDSATLFYDGNFLVKPGEDKNEFLTVAVGFR